MPAITFKTRQMHTVYVVSEDGPVSIDLTDEERALVIEAEARFRETQALLRSKVSAQEQERAEHQRNKEWASAHAAWQELRRQATEGNDHE